MISSEWIRSGATVLSAVLGSGILVALLHYRTQNANTKAETVRITAQASKIGAEADAIKIDDQTQIIHDLRTDRDSLKSGLKDLTDRVARLERRNDSLERLNSEMRQALLIVSHWVQRAWSVLTSDQRAEVGQPPEYEHLVKRPGDRNEGI